MQKVQLSWNLYETNAENVIQKHCKNCGQITAFTDSNIRRHNANGKNIYRFAIYKCPNGHTWNKKLEIYKAYTDHVRLFGERSEEQTEIDNTVSITTHQQSGIDIIEIILRDIYGTFRLDKTLAMHIQDWSRSAIVSKLKDGSILLNGNTVKPSTKLCVDDCISIFVS